MKESLYVVVVAEVEVGDQNGGVGCRKLWWLLALGYKRMGVCCLKMMGWQR